MPSYPVLLLVRWFGRREKSWGLRLKWKKESGSTRWVSLFLLLGLKGCRIKSPDGMGWANPAGLTGLQVGKDWGRRDSLLALAKGSKREGPHQLLQSSPPSNGDTFCRKEGWCPTGESTSLGLCEQFGVVEAPLPCPLSSILRCTQDLQRGGAQDALISGLYLPGSWVLGKGQWGTSEIAQVGSSGGCFRILHRNKAWSPKRWGAVGCIRKEVLFGGVPEWPLCHLIGHRRMSLCQKGPSFFSLPPLPRLHPAPWKSPSL